MALGRAASNNSRTEEDDMPRSKKPDRRKEIAELEILYKKGQLSEAIYRAALKGLGLDSSAVFNQKKQSVEQQITSPRLCR